MEKRIIISGSGGQGILFLGKILAHSAMKMDKEVTWFPSYGAEMRGGKANCTVVISDELIGSPIVRNAEYLIALNEVAYHAFIDRVVPSGMLIYDSSIIKTKKHREDISIVAVEATREAASIGNPKLANMVILGAFIKLTKFIDINKVFEALEEIIPSKRKDMIEINKKLILKGFSILEN